jgi:hypothetical protein
MEVEPGQEGGIACEQKQAGRGSSRESAIEGGVVLLLTSSVAC